MKLPTANNSSGNGYYGHETTVIFFSEPQSPIPIQNDDTPVNTDFSEYMWMEHEEEFDKQVLKQLEEEALMEQCIEAMLEDEHYANGVVWPNTNGSATGCKPSDANGTTPDLCQGMRSLRVQDDVVNKSTLNPDAAEFIPNFAPAVVTPSRQSAVTTNPDQKSVSDS